MKCLTLAKVGDFRYPIELPAGVDYDERLYAVVNCLNNFASKT